MDCSRLLLGLAFIFSLVKLADYLFLLIFFQIYKSIVVTGHSDIWINILYIHKI